MTIPNSALQPLIDPGVASAEGGLVFLDGPDGVALTMTSDAAQATGESLISAAEAARQQESDGN
jgi:hypothetical protein